jgi:tetratricopeptide (TPR) repeat protein
VGRCRRAGLLLSAALTAAGCVSLAPRSRTPSVQAVVVPGVPLATFDEDRCGPGSLALVLGAHGEAPVAGELDTLLPDAGGRGVLSVDMLLAARARGFDAALLAGNAPAIRRELAAGCPAVLMLRLLDAPGSGRDVYHYVVVDGHDPSRQLFRFQFGDGKGRWAPLASLEGSWKPAGRALLVVRPRALTDAAIDGAIGLERDRRFSEAAAAYRDVLAVRPDSVRAWVNLGNASAGAGERHEAETAYRMALSLSPADRDALNNLAWLLLEEGVRLEEAEALAARAAEAPGADRPLALDTLARVQIARGRCEDAASTAREALASPGLEGLARARLEEALTSAEQCPRRASCSGAPPG